MNKIVTLAATLVVASSAQVIAAPPVIDRYTQPFDFPAVDCGDFIVWTKGTESITEKWWYDDANQPVKLIFSVKIQSSEYYNGDDASKSISQGTKGTGENFTNRFDLISGDEHASGLPYRLTIPGIGHVLLDAGTWFWDASEETLTHKGPDFLLAEGEADLALCEALR